MLLAFYCLQTRPVCVKVLKQRAANAGFATVGLRRAGRSKVSPELPGGSGPRGLGQVWLCRELITINYELLGLWELLVWVFLLLICIQTSWSRGRAH